MLNQLMSWEMAASSFDDDLQILIDKLDSELLRLHQHEKLILHLEMQMELVFMQ
jgi:hypothetical protein